MIRGTSCLYSRPLVSLKLYYYRPCRCCIVYIRRAREAGVRACDRSVLPRAARPIRLPKNPASVASDIRRHRVRRVYRWPLINNGYFLGRRVVGTARRNDEIARIALHVVNIKESRIGRRRNHDRLLTGGRCKRRRGRNKIIFIRRTSRQTRYPVPIAFAPNARVIQKLAREARPRLNVLPFRIYSKCRRNYRHRPDNEDRAKSNGEKNLDKRLSLFHCFTVSLFPGLIVSYLHCLIFYIVATMEQWGNETIFDEHILLFYYISALYQRFSPRKPTFNLESDR